MRKRVIGALLGGVIVCAWGVLSWMALPWHSRAMRSLDHDVDVVRMLDFGTPASGIYLYPQAASREMKAGLPMAFVSFSKEGARPVVQAVLLGLCLQIAGAFILTWLISKTSGLAYGQKVLFAAAYGLAAGLLGAGPNWIWMNFAPDYTLLGIADSLISWTLAGLAIGKVL